MNAAAGADDNVIAQGRHHRRHHGRRDASGGHGKGRFEVIQGERQVSGHTSELVIYYRRFPVRGRNHHYVGAGQARQLAQDKMGAQAVPW